MRRKEDIEIDGVTFTVRPLNVGELMELAAYDDNPTTLVAYIVMSGTIDPIFKSIDDIPLNVCLDLANKIQELTMSELKGIEVEKEEPPNPFIV